MKRFKNILCVVPGTGSGKYALKRAVSLAEVNQAELTVISVMTPVSVGMGIPDGGPISVDLQAAALSVRKEALKSLVKSERGRMKINSRILVGVQFLEVIREVLSNERDLVIKAPEVQDWLGLRVGSEDMHLLRKCPCPVWLVRPGPKKSYRSVLAAVDVNDAIPPEELKTRQSINQQIVELASSVALADFAELHIVHAWQPVGEDTRAAILEYLPRTKLDAYIARLVQQREDGLLKLMKTVTNDLEPEVLDYLKPQSHLLRGRPRKEIPALARKLEADLVVMGTVARTGIPGLITGNTAESILSQIECSVLAVKPPGFQTPVTLDGYR